MKIIKKEAKNISRLRQQQPIYIKETHTFIFTRQRRKVKYKNVILPTCTYKLFEDEPFAGRIHQPIKLKHLLKSLGIQTECTCKGAKIRKKIKNRT